MRYEKGRKDSTRRKIVDVAAQRFRADGIAATGLAGVMSEAGLTNGAFYPHFQSKNELVAECVSTALEEQAGWIEETLAAGGLEGAISTYLSAAHRDNPGQGCPSAALLPEIARQSADLRGRYTEGLLALADQISKALPPDAKDPQATALGLVATLVGSLQMARAVDRPELSDAILRAGVEAALRLVSPPRP
jgi:TetR/AcrR family transcriptional regulator, transcriptional repressor for nem operon